MTATQKAIVPGILCCSLLLFFLNRMVNPPIEVMAAAESVVETEPAPASIEPEADGCVYQSRYPDAVRQWCQLIETVSAAYEIDPLLVAAVMLVESGGQPEVISHSGAVGLMQVMPRDGIASTFQCINGPCFANRPTIAELLDPEFNVEYGVRMLSGLIKKTGSPREALKSYGPYDVGYDYADKVLAIYANL